MKRLLILTAVCTLSLCACNKEAGSTYEFSYQDPSLTAEQRAEDLASRLTLDQKISLMMNKSAAVPEFGIHAYDWWSEALHGSARSGISTVFPQTIGMAASFDPELLQQCFDVASTEQRVKFISDRQKLEGRSRQYCGLTVWTPNINIFRDPRWGRGQETYGEDPYLTAVMGQAVVRGLQGPEGHKYDKLHACLKHYAVHSGPEPERHRFNAEDVSYRDLQETYLYAFERIVKTTDVQEVMCAYNAVEGRPCCGSDNLLRHFLRDEWGYKGLVVSDCGAINDFSSENGHHTYYQDKAASAANAVITGTDLECGNDYTTLKEAVDRGLIKEEDIDVSVRRLLKARFALGEMDPDDSVEWNAVGRDTLDCPSHQILASRMARETMTLLQNTDGFLPLAKTGRKYAVLGYNAKDINVNWGNYCGKPQHQITAYEGIAEKVGEENVIYVETPFLVADVNEKEIKAIVEAVKDADAVIYVGGISPYLEGEEMRVNYEGFYGGDRTSIELPEIQRATIKAISESGKPVVLVNMSGSAVALEPETRTCQAILQAWYAGEKAGEAIADVLFGDFNPAGKLPLTFYRHTDDLPDFSDYDMEGRTYRYFTGEALFPFGFGLSYTTFNLGDAKLCKAGKSKGINKFSAKDKLNLVVPVTNTGSADGDETVQVYIRKAEDMEGPKYALRGFKRVSVKAGETVDAVIPLDEFNFRTFNPQSGKMETTKGEYTVLYGTSSDEKDLASLTVYCK